MKRWCHAMPRKAVNSSAKSVDRGRPTPKRCCREVKPPWGWPPHGVALKALNKRSIGGVGVVTRQGEGDQGLVADG